jgi:ABC-type multidrug transport system ATPase subunit
VIVTARVLEASGLSKRFEDHEALRDVTFAVEGGIVGLIGPNGAGKSTLIKALLGLVRPSAGEARVLGLDTRRDGLAIRQRVGVLHEKPRFPARVTGRDFLAFSAALRSIPNAQREIEQAASDAGIASALDRRIGAYSAGMTQRLGLACAIMGNPGLVILDEPTANLDPRGRAETLAHIESLWTKRGIHVLFSTHLLSEVERVCDSVILLDAGRVLASGSLAQLKANHSRGARMLVRVDKPDEFVTLWAKEYGSTHGLTVEGDRVLIEIPKQRGTIARINTIARLGGFEIIEQRLDSATLEDLFIATTAREAGEA